MRQQLENWGEKLFLHLKYRPFHCGFKVLQELSRLLSEISPVKLGLVVRVPLISLSSSFPVYSIAYLLLLFSGLNSKWTLTPQLITRE